MLIKQTIYLNYTNAQLGTYQYIIVDSNNCTSLSNIVNVTAEPSPTITETHTNVTCNGLINGTATISALPTNGYTVTYSIDGTKLIKHQMYLLV